MSKAIEIKEENFDSITKNGLVLIDFWASWCAPCRMQAPIMDKLAESIGDKAVIGKIDVDACANVVSKYDIKSIPTLILFKDAQVIQTWVGVQEGSILEKAINDSL